MSGSARRPSKSDAISVPSGAERDARFAFSLAAALFEEETEEGVLRVAAERAARALRARSASAWRVDGEAGGDGAFVSVYEFSDPGAAQHGSPEERTGEHLRCPVEHPGVRFGVLTFERSGDDPFVAADRAFAEGVAEACSNAVARVRALGDAQRASRRREELLGVVAHELRGPLNTLLGWATMLRARSSDGAALQTGLDVIERNARAQARMIADVLDVSRLLRGTLEVSPGPLDLGSALRGAEAVAASAAAAKGVRFELCDELPGVLVWGDEERIPQVLAALCEFAVHRTPKGGAVTVRARLVDGRVEVWVRDTGPAMPPGQRERLLDRIEARLARQGRVFNVGDSFGLTVARHLLEAHGGALTAEAVDEGPEGMCLVATLTLFEGVP